MRKYQIVFSAIFLVAFLVYLYSEFSSLKKTLPIRIQDLNNSIINFSNILPMQDTKTSNTTYTLWGMKKSKTLEEREQKLEAENLLKALENDELKNNDELKKYENINVTHRTICIEKICWLYVGKVEIGNTKTVTLLLKEQKPKLETYNIGDYLSKKTKIIDIENNYMSVFNEDTMESFNLTLFDINVSQYKPKVTKELNE